MKLYCFFLKPIAADDCDGLTEKPRISELMQEFADKDKDYDGLVVVVPCKIPKCDLSLVPVKEGPPCPVLFVQEDGT